MEINIRKNIKHNFSNSNEDEIKNSINDAIQEQDEITLPGLGVFFEILWNNSSESEKETIVKKIHNKIKG